MFPEYGMALRPDATAQLAKLLSERILILDGAMGTMIQGYRLGEADYRGTCLAGHAHDLKGDNDVLALTKPLCAKSFSMRDVSAGVSS